MSDVTWSLPSLPALDLPAPWLPQSARAIKTAMTCLGGGVLFAATVYIMAALPGLLE